MTHEEKLEVLYEYTEYLASINANEDDKEVKELRSKDVESLRYGIKCVELLNKLLKYIDEQMETLGDLNDEYWLGRKVELENIKSYILTSTKDERNEL